MGGDYYDFVEVGDGRTAIVIADVSGKGVPAAMLTAAIRSAARIEAQRAGTVPVSEIVGAMNRWAVRDASDDMFVTVFLGILDPAARTLTYTNGGHCRPMLSGGWKPCWKEQKADGRD